MSGWKGAGTRFRVLATRHLKLGHSACGAAVTSQLFRSAELTFRLHFGSTLRHASSSIRGRGDDFIRQVFFPEGPLTISAAFLRSPRGIRALRNFTLDSAIGTM